MPGARFTPCCPAAHRKLEKNYNGDEIERRYVKYRGDLDPTQLPAEVRARLAGALPSSTGLVVRGCGNLRNRCTPTASTHPPQPTLTPAPPPVCRRSGISGCTRRGRRRPRRRTSSAASTSGSCTASALLSSKRRRPSARSRRAQAAAARRAASRSSCPPTASEPLCGQGGAPRLLRCTPVFCCCFPAALLPPRSPLLHCSLFSLLLFDAA